MARPLKILAGIVGAFVLLFLIAAIALSLFFDPNDFREKISEAVYDETGRELVIEGDISLSIFPWLAVDVGKTTMSDSRAFGGDAFMSFESASFAVELLPAIFSQEVDVSSADITGLDLNLKVDRNGKGNWSDMAPPEPRAAADEDGSVTATASAPSDLDIGSVDLINARISYADAAAQPIVLTELNVGIDGMTGREQLVVDGFSVDGVVEGVAAIPTVMTIRTDEIVIDSAESVMTLAPIVVEILGMRINANVEPFSYENDLTPKASIEIEPFSPRSVMTQFDVEPPVTADPSALGEMSVTATAQVAPNAIKMSDVRLALDDTDFSGNISVPLGKGGMYRFDLRGNTIDIGRYMEPADESAEATAGDAVSVDIPVDLIRTLKAAGTATLQRATLGAIVFEKIELGLNVDNNKLRLHPVSSDLFGGAYRGDVQIDASGSAPVLSVNERIENVNVGELAQAMFGVEKVTGTINGTFRLSGRGNNSLAIQESLAGEIGIDLADGAFHGTDVWYQLRRARSKLKNEPPPEPVLPPKTDFSTASMSGTVTNGVVRNADLFAQLPYMQLTGTGDIDLVSATMDYVLQARILERPEFLGDVSQEEIDDFTSAVIPLRVTGPLASPNVKPDVERLIRDRVEEEIKDRLKDKLGDLFN